MKKLVHSLILASLLSTPGLQAQDPGDKSSPAFSFPEASLPTAELNTPAEKTETAKPNTNSLLLETNLPTAEMIAPAEQTQTEPATTSIAAPEASLPSAEFKPPEFRKKNPPSDWHNWVVAAGFVVSVTAGIILVSMDKGARDPNF